MSDQETMESPIPETTPETPEEPSASPTYKQDQWFELEHYICLRCGHEGWSYETFKQHMDVYHQGVMIEAPPGYAPPVAEEKTPAGEDVAEGETPVAETQEGEKE